VRLEDICVKNHCENFDEYYYELVDHGISSVVSSVIQCATCMITESARPSKYRLESIDTFPETCNYYTQMQEQVTAIEELKLHQEKEAMWRRLEVYK